MSYRLIISWNQQALLYMEMEITVLVKASSLFFEQTDHQEASIRQGWDAEENLAPSDRLVFKLGYQIHFKVRLYFQFTYISIEF